MRVLFKGQSYIVILADEKEVAKAQSKGLFIQRGNELYTKDGKKVIVTSSPIEAHGNFQNCNRLSNPFPYIASMVKEDDMVVYAYGSVNNIRGSMVFTNWHVVDKAVKAKLCNMGVQLALINEWRPRLIPYWAYALLQWIQRYIPVKPLYSFFDYAQLTAGYDIQDIVKWSITPNLVYTAGTCNDVNEQNCVGVALPIPLPGYVAPPPVDLPLDYIGYCTYWGYEFSGRIIDYGESTVWYDDGVAVFKNAYLLNFFGKPGIPGCSGSPVIVNTRGVRSSVSFTVDIKPISE